MLKLLATTAAILCSLPAIGSADATCATSSGNSLVPLVELYTSEGCSSCPPADRWLSAQTGRADINLLAFHVDYWDAIGWPDRFALRESADRQRKRVNAAGGSTVYTPQVMVGRQTRVQWNSKEAFESALFEGNTVAEMDLALELSEKDGEWELALEAGKPKVSAPSARVWLAQTLDGQTTKVGGGENRGATLRHDRIVTQLWGPWTPPVRQMIRLARQTAGQSSWHLVAFAQDGDGHTLQSLALAGDCTVTAH
ncbi:DUF1223 domain-containing protein [Dokdonella sp.]|uniref:DUF1223 domain-containing protein n=1 Tax=Dokdonella sp. TaxID=2291710 RepID=UPI003527AF71